MPLKGGHRPREEYGRKGRPGTPSDRSSSRSCGNLPNAAKKVISADITPDGRRDRPSGNRRECRTDAAATIGGNCSRSRLATSENRRPRPRSLNPLLHPPPRALTVSRLGMPPERRSFELSGSMKGQAFPRPMPRTPLRRTAAMAPCCPVRGRSARD